MAKTQRNLPNELKITVYDAIAKRILNPPLVIRNAVLADRFEPRNLRSLLMLTLSEQVLIPHDLRNHDFGDDNQRNLALSAGKIYYFGHAKSSIGKPIC